MMPLSYAPLEFASSFHSEQCPEGIVSITGDSLRIFTTEQLGDMFNQTSISHDKVLSITSPNTNTRGNPPSSSPKPTPS
jgi:hypothetical protein